MVRGLRPDPRIHASYLEMEPTFGATVDSRLRVQYNFNLIRPFQLYRNFNLDIKHKPTVIPFIWIEESYTVYGFFRFLLQFCSIFFVIISYFYAFVASFGICLIVIGVIRWLKKLIKNRMAVNNDDMMIGDDKEKF
ncbi:CD36-like protein [Euroglyphus maynei]|uniref:Scavenger receptor class B member 1 n=1 Tax=Euroglyphus maynei TaxID=6958 RepID=A0A1Y3AX21_EURMA|nr:CD36-like protein [Euroglyphus maynei]